MACKCCQRYAPKHRDGSPQGPCPGDVALKEARDLARLWYQRAQDSIAPSTNIARCQNGHNVRVGSPMHDQLLERGCFKCDAFPEVVA